MNLGMMAINFFINIEMDMNEPDTSHQMLPWKLNIMAILKYLFYNS